jgi:membrane-associated phospholipid phosphatase
VVADRLGRTDRLLAGYILFVTIMIVVRRVPLADAMPLVAMHLLFGAMLALFTRLEPQARVGRFLHALYPLVMLVPFYEEFGIINQAAGVERILAHDAVVQAWEAALFGGQVSYEWIRAMPSVFWSAVLHVAYLGFYPIVVLGPILFYLRHQHSSAHRVVFSMMLGFVACYVVFLAYPVAGPYYAFPHPTGPVRDVFSARLVYDLLDRTSSIGAAFPSSHVASSVAFVVAAWSVDRRLAMWFVVPTALMVVATVYCQMHYGIDAVAGLGIGLAAGVFGSRWSVTGDRNLMSSRAAPTTDHRLPVTD